MTAEKSTLVAREMSRRTILKGTAWSVPVLAAAVAAPAYAASIAVNLILSPANGDSFTVNSPDGTRSYTMNAYNSIRATVTGTSPVPAGSTLVASYDNRIFDTLTVTALATGTALAAATSVSGNVTTMTFAISVPIDANNVYTHFVTAWASVNRDWYTDVASTVFTITPPPGYRDTDPTWDSITDTPQYTP